MQQCIFLWRISIRCERWTVKKGVNMIAFNFWDLHVYSLIYRNYDRFHAGSLNFDDCSVFYGVSIAKRRGMQAKTFYPQNNNNERYRGGGVVLRGPSAGDIRPVCLQAGADRCYSGGHILIHPLTWRYAPRMNMHPSYFCKRYQLLISDTGGCSASHFAMISRRLEKREIMEK